MNENREMWLEIDQLRNGQLAPSSRKHRLFSPMTAWLQQTARTTCCGTHNLCSPTAIGPPYLFSVGVSGLKQIFRQNKWICTMAGWETNVHMKREINFLYIGIKKRFKNQFPFYLFIFFEWTEIGFYLLWKRNVSYKHLIK